MEGSVSKKGTDLHCHLWNLFSFWFSNSVPLQLDSKLPKRGIHTASLLRHGSHSMSARYLTLNAQYCTTGVLLRIKPGRPANLVAKPVLRNCHGLAISSQSPATAFPIWLRRAVVEIILCHGSPPGLIYFGLKEGTCFMCLSSSHRGFYFFFSFFLRAEGQVLSLEPKQLSKMRWSQLCQAGPELPSEPFPNTSDLCW